MARDCQRHGWNGIWGVGVKRHRRVDGAKQKHGWHEKNETLGAREGLGAGAASMGSGVASRPPRAHIRGAALLHRPL